MKFVFLFMESEINNQLKKLKMLPLSENDKTTAAEIGELVAQVHSHDLVQSKLPVYDARWLAGLVRKCKACECKNEIISALEKTGNFESYSYDGPLKINKDKFMTWDMGEAKWQGEYRSGHIGSYVWDIAAIINHANNPVFSDAFLDSYVRHSEKNPTLAALHANLYYVQVAEAARRNDFEAVAQTTKKLTEQNIFKTELIPYETIVQLKMIGF